MTQNPAPILVLAHLIIDDVTLQTGETLQSVPGGAALYAATGAAQWWPNVGIVTGVGADLHVVTDGLLRRHALRDEGLLMRDPHTIRSRLVYRAGDERSETPLHGEAHFQRMETGIADIPAALLPAAGSYVFRTQDRAFWDGVRGRRAELGVILWELHGEAARPELWEEISKLLAGIDIVSLNLAEACRLLGTSSLPAIADRLLEGGAHRVLLRMGADGALFADASQRLRLYPPPSPIEDVTGAGNSFCGGFLAGWCLRPGDPAFAARCAAAAAACTMAQFGPAPPCDRPVLESLATAARIEPLHDGLRQ